MRGAKAPSGAFEWELIEAVFFPCFEKAVHHQIGIIERAVRLSLVIDKTQ